jgi:Tfp pilus assembly protein PilF
MAKNQNPKPAQRPAPRPAPAPQPISQPKKAVVEKKSMPLVNKLAIVLAVIACLVYANTLQNGYVLDDVMVIKENSMVQKGFAGIPELLSTPHLRGHLNLATDTYRPLSLVMYAIEYQLFGLTPSAGHFFNIVLFVACVLALFFFLNKLFDGKRMVVAFMATLLFAVHPIHVEVVANIKSRDELLCYFFAFLSLNVFINYMRDGKWLQLLLGTFCLYLAFISKETVITFIGIIPLVFFFYKNENRTRAIFIAAGTLVAAGIFLGMREAILNEYHSNAPYVVKFLDNFLAGAPNGAVRMATAISLLGQYLALMFIPYPLVCDHSYNSTPFVGFGNVWAILSLVAYLAMASVAVYRLFKYKKDPWAFGLLFYLITISLFSNIPFLVGAARADRFAFFASTGTCIIMALAIEKWILRTEEADVRMLTSKALSAMIPLGLIYGALTIDRNSDWKDNYTLYKTDVEKSPNNTRLYYYMGAELQRKYDEATDQVSKDQIVEQGLKYLRRSLEIYPNNVDSHAELGATYFRAKQYDSAVVHLKRALQMNPKQINASTNLGTVYMTQNRFAEALPWYKLTVNVNPNHVLALFNLAVCYAQTMKYDSSAYYFKKTIQIDPAYLNHKATEYTAMVYNYLGQKDSVAKYQAMAQQFNPQFRVQ